MNYIIYYENFYLVKNEINKITTSLNVSKDEILTYKFITSDDILFKIKQLSLFTIPKLIIIEDANIFSTGEMIKQQSEIINFVTNEKAISFLFITDAKISKTFKNDNFKISVLENITNKSKKKFIDNLLKEKELNLDVNIYDKLLESLNDDPMVINNEIMKLKLLSTMNPTNDELANIISNYNSDNIFKFFEYLLWKKESLVWTLYEELKLKKTDEIQIINLLASQVVNAILYKKLVSRNIDNYQIATLLALPIFVINMYKNTFLKYNINNLTTIALELYKLEKDIKLSRIDKVIGFKNYIIQLLGGNYGR